MNLKKSIKEYDLILVLGYFRSALSYLSIVKNLNFKKIGLVIYSSKEVINKKVDVYTEKFISLLLDNGAERCSTEENYFTNQILIQQHLYDEEFLKTISRNISYKKAIALIGYRMGYGGNDLFLKHFKIDICAINDKNLFKLFVTYRNCESLYKEYEIREVGIPFLKYPPFETPDIDWLIASPTTFSFENEEDKHQYLKNVMNLLCQIDYSKKIVYKPHNGNQKDYFQKYNILAKFIPFTNIAIIIVESLINFLPKFLKKNFSFLLTALLNERISKRVINLSKLTDKYYLPVEAFIPKLKYGVIGGNSNTIWATRFYRKKYLNCINQEEFKKKDISRKKNKTLLLNLSYFGVPFCENDINFTINSEFRDFKKNNKNIVDLIKENFDE